MDPVTVLNPKSLSFPLIRNAVAPESSLQLTALAVPQLRPWVRTVMRLLLVRVLRW